MKTHRTYSPKPHPFRLSNLFYPIVSEQVKIREEGTYVTGESACWNVVYIFGFCVFAKMAS